MTYRVFIDRAAVKDIDRLPMNIRKLVLEEIKELGEDPRKPGAEPLEGNLKPYWKTRVGDYRIAYEIRDDQVIVYVVRVLDRKEIYRILGRMQRQSADGGTRNRDKP